MKKKEEYQRKFKIGERVIYGGTYFGKIVELAFKTDNYYVLFDGDDVPSLVIEKDIKLLVK